MEKKFYTPWIPIDPVLARKSAREDYRALVDEIEQQLNAERALLELPPVTLARQVAKIDAIPDKPECRGSEDGRE